LLAQHTPADLPADIRAAQARWAEDRALELLRLALARGYGQDRAALDSDLQRIQRRPEFRQMLAAFGETRAR
jgi:hypothetical protein